MSNEISPNKKIYYCGCTNQPGNIIIDNFCHWEPEFKIFSVIRKKTMTDKLYFLIGNLRIIPFKIRNKIQKIFKLKYELHNENWPISNWVNLKK